MSSTIITTVPPNVDWSATAAWLGIFATLAISIVTPAISTYLNNRFQLRLKESELKYLHQKDLYSKKREIYETFLHEAGKFIQYDDYINCSIPRQYAYQLYLYLPAKHWPLVNIIIRDTVYSDPEDIKRDMI